MNSQQRWTADAQVLARIGADLFRAETRVRVRISSELADLAITAWQRDDDSAGLSEESPAERDARHRAGSLALIGLALVERGQLDGDHFEVDLEAWFIGHALDAADEFGLLDLKPRTQ